MNLRVVAYVEGAHKVSCAVYDPTPDHCDCSPIRTPLVREADANIAIKALEEIVKNDPFKQSSAGAVARKALDTLQERQR